MARNNGATMNKAARAGVEASCDTATGATECGDAGATVAYNTAAAGRDVVQGGWLTGW